MRLIPSPGRVIVRQDDSILKPSGSLIIAPDIAKEADCARVGIVMAASLLPWTDEGIDRPIKFPLSVGDVVLFHVHEAMAIKLDGDELHVVNQGDILGRINV